jgi:hypothetical protein
MRHATWIALEASPVWRKMYGAYRKLPAAARSPIRWVTMPRWHAATTLIQVASGKKVVAGPFRGMRLELSPVSRRLLVSYILGSTELELREVIERILQKKYATILNVGAADGYYAIGMAYRSPRSRVVAFEALAALHRVIERAALLNGVADRIRISGRCDLSDLRRELQTAHQPTLVLMDIEGGESQLLDPSRCPELGNADILVETHDSFVPGCTDRLISRFGPTHQIERFVARQRVVSDYPRSFMGFLPRFFPRMTVDLMDERRAGVQQWLYLTPKPNVGKPQEKMR